MSQLLLSLLRHDSSQPSFIQQQAAAVADQCWRGLALKHSSWRCIVSCMLACKLDVQGLLQQLQGCFVDAAASAQGLDRLCGVLTALRECSSSCREAVHEMVSGAAPASALPLLLLCCQALFSTPHSDAMFITFNVQSACSSMMCQYQAHATYQLAFILLSPPPCCFCCCARQLSAAVASALSQASQATLLPPLLVLQRLLHGSTDYSKVLEAAAVQALGPDSPNSEWAAPVGAPQRPHHICVGKLSTPAASCTGTALLQNDQPCTCTAIHMQMTWATCASYDSRTSSAPPTSAAAAAAMPCRRCCVVLLAGGAHAAPSAASR